MANTLRQRCDLTVSLRCRISVKSVGVLSVRSKTDEDYLDILSSSVG